MPTKESLVLLHDEYRLFLQIILSGVLAVVVAIMSASLTANSFVRTVDAIRISIIIIMILSAITALVFLSKFTAIRNRGG